MPARHLRIDDDDPLGVPAHDERAVDVDQTRLSPRLLDLDAVARDSPPSPSQANDRSKR
jgi:hypothetical protein